MIRNLFLWKKGTGRQHFKSCIVRGVGSRDFQFICASLPFILEQICGKDQDWAIWTMW